MIDDNQDSKVSLAIELLIHGAKTLMVGHYLDQNNIAVKGLETIRRAIRAIDTSSPAGRDVLLPLLDHADEGVQVVAAGGLWQSHPDKAIPLLERMKRVSITEAGDLAMMILFWRGRFNPCEPDPKYESLHEDEHGIYKWDDPAFRSRILSGDAPTGFKRRQIV